MNDTHLTNGLSFFIETRSGISVLQWNTKGCRPATDPEMELWRAYRVLQRREKKLRDRIHSLEFQLEGNRRNVKRLKAKLKRCEYSSTKE